MSKIFKSKKAIKLKKNKIIKLLLISFLCAYFLSKIDIFSNDKVVNYLKRISLNELTIPNIKFKGEYLLNISLNSFDKIKFEQKVFSETEEIKEISKPVIYIYNSHQTEEYATLENYNLTPTVLTASYILKDKLNDYGIESIIETSDFKTDLIKYGYTYGDAYEVSRKWLEQLNNSNMLLYIDLHRDSVKYQYSNLIIDGKDYAKIMLVVGKNYDYEENMKVAEKIISHIENINKDISRGIFTREKGRYNQDYNKNCILIELGGPESTYESISNSLDILSLAIKNYLGE